MVRAILIDGWSEIEFGFESEKAALQFIHDWCLEEEDWEIVHDED